MKTQKNYLDYFKKGDMVTIFDKLEDDERPRRHKGVVTDVDAEELEVQWDDSTFPCQHPLSEMDEIEKYIPLEQRVKTQNIWSFEMHAGKSGCALVSLNGHFQFEMSGEDAANGLCHRLNIADNAITSEWIDAKEKPDTRLWVLVETPYCNYPAEVGRWNGYKWLGIDKVEIMNVSRYATFRN